MKNLIETSMSTPLLVRIVRWGFCLVILAAIIGGLVVVGSPAQRRREALDEQRVNSLNSITYAIDTYYQSSSSTLPTNLEALGRHQPYLSPQLVDPATNKPYEYRALPDPSGLYELCATFETQTDTSWNGSKTIEPNQSSWIHPVGRTCFTQRVRIQGQPPVPFEAVITPARPATPPPSTAL